MIAGINLSSLTVDQARELFFALKEMINPQLKGRLRKKYRDYESWDWTKNNHALAREHDVSYGNVCSQRRRLGKPSVSGGKNYPDCLGWDWSKPDAEISREHGIMLGSVRNWRIKLNKPRAAPKNRKFFEPIPDRVIDFGSVDWNEPDNAIAKQLNCSREYVRQKRASLGLSASNFWAQRYAEFMKAFGQDKQLLYSQVQERFPKCSPYTFKRYCHKAGIKVLPKPRLVRTHPWHLIDFRLPNRLLEEIWHLPWNTAANQRSVNQTHAPHFSYHRGHFSPEWTGLVQEQRKAAQEWFIAKQEVVA